MIKGKKLYSINKKFKRYHGWSGADGIFTYKYNQKIIMYFSDTFVGESNTKGQRVSFKLINNQCNQTKFLVVKDEISRGYNFQKSRPTIWTETDRNRGNSGKDS